jgi:hypothetical protein
LGEIAADEAGGTMALLDPQSGNPAVGYGHIRASSGDRDRAVDVLKAGFAEGRLTKEEYDERTGQVYSSRTYGELARLTADLPAGPLGGLSPAPAGYPAPSAGYELAVPSDRTNGLAIASLVCALIPVVPGIVAIFLGFGARNQIRQRGGRGIGLANAGITIGVLSLLAFVIYVAASS